MKENYFEGKEFKNINFSKSKFEIAEYENCSFIGCNFSKVNLSNSSFTDCKFKNCDFSMVKNANVAFRKTDFTECKLLGFHFENCNEFLLSFSFTNCQLNFSSFHKMKLHNTKFINCKLQEVDFTEADFTNSNFENCDFTDAIFNRSTLDKCDFSTSYNFIIDPENNKLAKAKFSSANVLGLLAKYNIEIEWDFKSSWLFCDSVFLICNHSFIIKILINFNSPE